MLESSPVRKCQPRSDPLRPYCSITLRFFAVASVAPSRGSMLMETTSDLMNARVVAGEKVPAALRSAATVLFDHAALLRRCIGGTLARVDADGDHVRSDECSSRRR